VWEKLVAAQVHKHSMTAGIADKKKDMEAVLKNGLRANHCYTIMSAHEVKSNNKPVRLLRLRNPWGCEEWNGHWSDNSALWSDKLRAEVGSTIENDGIFFINLDDYMQNFTFTNICKFNEDDVDSIIFKEKPVPI